MPAATLYLAEPMPPTRPHPSHRLRFELILGSVLLAVGLFAVPAVVFWVGIKLLGPYGEGAGAGLATFYADFFGDLAAGVGRAWSLALGPLVLISLLRLLFLRRPPMDEPADGQGEDDAAPRQSVPRETAAGRRKEPSVSFD